MLRFKILLALFVLILSSLACNAILGDDEDSAEVQPNLPQQSESAEEPQNDSTDSSDSSAPLACPALTEQIVAMNSPSNSFDESASDYDYAEDEEEESIPIVSYTIEDDELQNPVYEDVPAKLEKYQEDEDLHRRIWHYFANLIPPRQRAMLTEFSIASDGADNTLASVVQTDDDPKYWRLEVDSADADNYYYLSFTLVHEFAHLLTLNASQVPPNLAVFNNPEDNDIYLKAISTCDTFFPGEGCSNSDSYINAFYQEFWTEIYDEWNEINLAEGEDDYQEKLDNFYYTYEDQFLSDYSTTHPAEDIAEAFSFFVFSDKPSADLIANQKILFFYQYPELVQLREKILSNLCENFPEQ